MGLFKKRSFRKKDPYYHDKSHTIISTTTTTTNNNNPEKNGAALLESKDDDGNEDDSYNDDNDENISPPNLTLTSSSNLSCISTSSSPSKDKNTNYPISKGRPISESSPTKKSHPNRVLDTSPRSEQPSSELSSEHQHHQHHHRIQNPNSPPKTAASPPQHPPPPTLPQIIHDLSTSHQTFSTPPSLALRHLFSSTEHNTTHEQTRIRLAREADGRLIPALLTFLQRCERGSSERYLTLLVLNNLSIPCENKRLVAVEYGGAHVLARELCRDPGCHVVGIILANLCFSDANLRRQLVCAESSSELICALGYALRVSLLPQHRVTTLKDNPNNDDMTPRQLLEQSLERDPPRQVPLNDDDDDAFSSYDEEEDNIIHHNSNNDDDSPNDHHHQHSQQPPPPPQPQQPPPPREKRRLQNCAYPETVRWCLCAIKSLTRPCRDPFAAQSLLDSRVLPLLLEILYVPFAEQQQQQQQQQQQEDNHRNGRKRVRRRGPQEWEIHSIQDLALYIMVNLSITPSARGWLRREEGVVMVLGNIASYSAASGGGGGGCEEEDREGLEVKEIQKGIQCLKARMSLAFLFGSEGHFGQGRLLKPITDEEPTSNQLLTKGSEAPILVELVSNSLHCRGKDGPGGYSASTFNAKKTLFAVRCLLTNSLNVKTFYVTCGVKLNALLFKSIALHSIQLTPVIDVEAVEDACFSLYLLSNYGFMGPFLPASSAGKDGTLFAKVLLSYLRRGSITNAGRHAAEQLLLRSPYLNFDGILDDGDEPLGIQHSDFEFNSALLHAAEAVEGGDDLLYGESPLDDAFGRPVIRQRVNKRTGRGKASLWEDDSSDIVAYHSALDAVQHLSFGSSCVQHVGRLDDILIANNIVNSANGGAGKRTELYGYQWSWQDDGLVFDRDIQQRLRELQTDKIDSVRGIISKVREKKFMNYTEPLSIFGIKCGCNSNTIN